MQESSSSSSSSSSNGTATRPPEETSEAERRAFEEWCRGRVPVKVTDLLQNKGKVGEGGYGEVFKAIFKQDQQRSCAVKKLLRNHEKEGFPITSVREIKLLRELGNSPNIVSIIKIVTSCETENVFVLFEYMEHDLDGLLQNVQLPPAHVKCYFKQMLQVWFCVMCGVLRCDVWCAAVQCSAVWYGVVWCGVVWCGVVCRRRCYQKAMAGMSTHGYT